MNKKLNAYMISMMGLLIAIMVVLSRILGLEWQFIKISFDFVPKIVMAMMFGSIWTGIGAVGTAILGMILFKEPATVARLACMALIVGGIVGLKVSAS